MAVIGLCVHPLPALTLILASPLIGEFLLGNMAIDMLWLLPLLALLYGTGALLVRELSFHFGAGWPGIAILGLAYGIIEEGLVTRSLFDPDFLGLRLLDYGYVQGVGIGAWWTVFVLGLHAIWSIAAAIALSEALWPKHSASRWLSAKGLAATTLLFGLGCVAVAAWSGPRPSVTDLQLLATGGLVASLIALAWFVGATPTRVASGAARTPSPVTAGISAFSLLSMFMLTTWTKGSVSAPANVGMMLCSLACLAILVRRWAEASGWGPRHRLGLTAGALLTYGWWSLLVPATLTTSTSAVDLIGNLAFLGLALILLAVAWQRTAEACLGDHSRHAANSAERADGKT